MPPRGKINPVIIIIVILVLVVGFVIRMTYNAYLTRSKISEAFLLVVPIQNALNDFAIKNAGFPLDGELTNTSFGLPEPFEIQGTYIKSVVAHKDPNAQNATILANINTDVIPNVTDSNDNTLSNPNIRFVGKFDGKSTLWQCTSNIAKKYLPDSCSGN